MEEEHRLSALTHEAAVCSESDIAISILLYTDPNNTIINSPQQFALEFFILFIYFSRCFYVFFIFVFLFGY